MGSWALTDGRHKWAGGGGQAELCRVGADKQQWHLSTGNPDAEHGCCQKNKVCPVALILWPALSACLGHLSSGRPSVPSPSVLLSLCLGSFPNPCPTPAALPHPLPTDLLVQGSPCHHALSHLTAAPCLFQPCPNPACPHMWLAQDTPVAIPLTRGSWLQLKYCIKCLFLGRMISQGSEGSQLSYLLIAPKALSLCYSSVLTARTGCVGQADSPTRATPQLWG